MFGDAVVIRCSLGTVAEYPVGPEDWGDPGAIARLWSDSVLREAVLLASPVLAAQIDKLHTPAGADAPLKKRKRLHRSLLKYALRLSSRCTPFGMFAGVAVLPVGDGEPVLGTSHVRHVRASGGAARRFAEEARSLPQAWLYPNPALAERSGRLMVTVMRGVEDTHTLATIRATGPARLALSTAAGSATRRDIEQRVAEAYPDAGMAKVERLIDDLLAAEVLLCEAEHSAFDGDPLSRVPDAVEGVTEMRAAVSRYANSSDPVHDGSLPELLRLCSPGDTQRDIHVDLEVDATGCMPASVVAAGRDAVAALTTTMAHLPWTPALDEFSARFAERYGNTLVPLMTAVDEELGIGYPAGYGTAEPKRSATGVADDPAAERRRDLIAELLQRSRSGESGLVELTDGDLRGFPELDDMPSSFDVMLRLHRDRAGLQATYTGIGVPGGSAVGRFTTVMPWARDFAGRCVELDARWWADRTDGRGILCGVDYIAGTDSVNEVAATAQLYAVTLAVNAVPHPPNGRVLTLADIYLGHAGGRVRTVLADGTPLAVRQLSMATTHASAKAIRLLYEISIAGIRVPVWSWGEAEAILNHLPGVRYRGVTLVEERWRFPGAADRTRAAVQEWIAEAGVSRYIRVGPHDNRLHLDTQNPAHVDLMLAEITAGNRWIQRAPAPDQLGVIADAQRGMHAAEVVVTIAAPKTSRAEPDLIDYPLHDPSADRYRLLLPGGPWTTFTINAARGTHDRLLRDFAEAFPQLAGQWYFVRYRQDGRAQLRLRVQRPVDQLGDVLAWLTEVRVTGRIGDYTIPIHHRELERYGGPRSFACYERLFCQETAHIVGMLPLLDPNPLPRKASASLIRPGVDVAAGVLAQWFDALDPERADSDDVIDVAISNYTGELGTSVHTIKTALRQQYLHIDAENALTDSLREFWSDPAQSDAAMTSGVLQSASHLLCNRLGLYRRHEEFAVMWMIKAERNRRKRRDARNR